MYEVKNELKPHSENEVDSQKLIRVSSVLAEPASTIHLHQSQKPLFDLVVVVVVNTESPGTLWKFRFFFFFFGAVQQEN